MICQQYGIRPKIIDKSKATPSVQKMFLKDNSIGKLLNLTFVHQPKQKLMIKLEIDINPPLGFNSEIKFLDFQLAFSVSVTVQDLSSNFAGKSHTILCRNYTKGRDWYDFNWYVANKISPNLIFLENTINQTGPWAKQNIKITREWYIETLTKKIKSIDWEQAAMDVAPFLKKRDQESLKVWGSEFFLDRLNKLKQFL